MSIYGAFVQFVKDIREEITLPMKWESLDRHLPSWLKDIDLQQIGPGCLVDAGCHYGLVSIHYIRATGQPSYGFDINPQINALLRRTLRQSSYRGKMHVMGFGLSDQKRETTAYIDTRYSGAATIRKDQVGLARDLLGLDLAHSFPAHVERLDDLAIPERIAAIKIDCEGHEASILRGGMERIRRDRPVLFFEALTPQYLEECTTLLSEMGYSVRALDSRNYLAGAGVI